MGPVEVWNFCQVYESAKSLLQAATKQLNLSARELHRMLKLSRTIVDLAGEEGVGVAQLGKGAAIRAKDERLTVLSVVQCQVGK